MVHIGYVTTAPPPILLLWQFCKAYMPMAIPFDLTKTINTYCTQFTCCKSYWFFAQQEVIVATNTPSSQKSYFRPFRPFLLLSLRLASAQRVVGFLLSNYQHCQSDYRPAHTSSGPCVVLKKLAKGLSTFATTFKPSTVFVFL
jgi:hypothetical protein